MKWKMSFIFCIIYLSPTLLYRLSCYFHGNHHLEEILMLENMTRSQLLSLIDKFSEILTTASFPEHS